MPIVQGQTYSALFFLTDALSPPDGLPGQAFSGSEILIIKPNAATSPAANISTVVDKGGGWYMLTLTAGETSIGLVEGGVGEIGIEIDKTGAVPSRALGYDVVATSPGTLTTAERAAVAASVAAPSAATIAAAVDAAVADNFASLAASIAAIPPAPTASTVASTVLSSAVDGPRTVQQALAIAGATGNKATLPMAATGGPISVRNAADTATLMAGAIGADGVRTWTTAPGIP